MIFSGYSSGGCGCQHNQLEQAPEAASFVATYDRSQGVSVLRSVGLGVMTGVLVWTITRWLDGKRRT